jgi:hypothetical protein
VFGDRLINNIDRNFLTNLILEKSNEKFKLKKEVIFNSQRIIFADFMDGIDVETRVYRQIEDLKLLQTKIEEYLMEYNG